MRIRSSSDLLAQSSVIAHSICDRRIATERGFTWKIRTRDPLDRNAPVRLIDAGPWVYSGASGIGLLLLELYRLLGESRFLETAIGSFAHSTNCATDQSAAASYFSGRIGLLAAYHRLYITVGDPEYRRIAQDLVPKEIPIRDGQDLIAGAAGGIPVLLEFGEATGCDESTFIAIELGNDLLAKARSTPEGLSWGEPSNAIQARNLCGLAHGASGIAVAFSSLFAATGDPRFRRATEDAFAYEDSFFSESVGNWPDFRSSAFTSIAEFRDSQKLSEYLGTIDYASLAYREKYMSAWCHGSPGILLARAHAAARGIWHGEERTLRRAIDALVADLSSGEGLENHSLCHGALGNIECAVTALAVLSEEHIKGTLPPWAHSGMPSELAAIRTGTADGGSDPSLMMGEAGIAYALARLSGAAIPSLLIPSISDSVVFASFYRKPLRSVPFQIDELTLRSEESIVSNCGSTTTTSVTRREDQGAREASPTSFGEFSRRFIARFNDRSLAGIRDMVPLPSFPIPRTACVRKSVFVETVNLHEDCTNGPMESTVVRPTDREISFVGFIQEGSPHLLRIGSLSALALEAIGERTISVEEALIEARALSASHAPQIDHLFVLQLYELIRARLIDLVLTGRDR